MNNKIEVFKNEQFGEVRTILEGETLLFWRFRYCESAWICPTRTRQLLITARVS